MKYIKSYCELDSRQKVRLMLDHDVVDFFKRIDDYEELINEILRRHMDEVKGFKN